MITLLKKVGFFIERIMKKLEATLINLFMWGELFSTQGVLDTTIIQCEGFIFEFRQQDIKLKQSEYINKTILTTIVTVRDITEEQIPQILEIIDNICWLLSFAQQSPVARHDYKVNANKSFNSCSHILINPLRNIIDDRGEDIRKFVELTYPTFKKLKSSRQLPIVIGYLCEANRSSLALEIALISHYIAIENLKNTFALEQQYQYSGQYFIHKNFPHLDNPPKDIENYLPLTKSRKKYVHRKFGQVSSTEMTFKMFEDINFNRTKIKPFLTKRHKIIHEGILLPCSGNNYNNQAIVDRCDVSDLLRQYLLTLLNYKGTYYLSRDRIGCSGLIT